LTWSIIKSLKFELLILQKGLFHQVIAQSGTPLAVWATDSEPLKSAQSFAQSVNCTIEGVAEMVECMKALPWQTLAEASLFNMVK